MIDYAQFLALFPEFSDATIYPETQIDAWTAIAYQQLSPRRFGTQLDYAVMLFVAHNIVLSARNLAAAAGLNPVGAVGAATGLLTSKSVGPVSASYDVTATTDANAGIYNATSYGQRFWRLLKAAGVGPMYVPGPVPVNLWAGPRGLPWGWGS